MDPSGCVLEGGWGSLRSAPMDGLWKRLTALAVMLYSGFQVEVSPDGIGVSSSLVSGKGHNHPRPTMLLSVIIYLTPP